MMLMSAGVVLVVVTIGLLVALLLSRRPRGALPGAPPRGRPPPGQAGPTDERLARETMAHLQALARTASAMPSAVVLPDHGAALRTTGVAGDVMTLVVEVRNPRNDPAVVAPMLSPLVAASGVVWIPEPEAVTLLLAAGDSGELRVTAPLPDELPAGRYSGALVIQGLKRSVPVTVVVEERPASEAVEAEGPETP